MIYKHKKTGQILQLKSDSGDIVTCYVLDENLNKIIDKNMIHSGNKYKMAICSKENLLEVLI